MYNEYKIQYCINFKFWANVLGQSLCTLTGWCMTQYIITILCDIVDHKIYSACVYLKSANRFQRFSHFQISSSSYAHLIVLYIIHQYIRPRDDISNRIYKYDYILHNIIRVSRNLLYASYNRTRSPNRTKDSHRI